MAELCCEYLPVRCIWRHILVIVTYTFQSESALYSTLHSTASTFTCPIVLYILPLYPLYALLPVWLNGWVFLYELSGCGFESCCSHFNFRFRSCFEQGVPWNSGNYRVLIHSDTHTWHAKNIQTICTLEKETEAAKQPFFVLNRVKHSFSLWVSVT